MERGEQYLAEGNYDKARIEFSNALQIQPSDADARYLSALTAEKAGDLRAATQGYQATLTVDETHPLAVAAFARLLVFSGLPEQALEAVEKSLVVHPEHIELLAIRGAARLALRREQEAFDDVSAVLAKDPDHEYAVALLAGIYRTRGEPQRAIDLLTGTLGRKPDRLDLRIVLTQLYVDTADNAKAEEELKRIVTERPLELQHRQRLVAFYTSTSRPELAETSLRELTELDAKSLQYKFALINHLAAQRSFDAAEKELVGFIAKDPKDYALRLAAGQFYEAHNLAPEAERIYKEVIAENGVAASGLSARNRLATLAIRANRAAEAEALIGEVLAENPSDNDALVLRASFALANRRPLDAITDLRSVLRDQPDAAPVLHTLARAHLQNNEPDLAREQYRRAVEVDPSNIQTRNEFADFLIRTGDVDAARPLLDSVLAADPQNLAALELKYRAVATAGDAAAATAVAREVMASYPDSPVGYYFEGVLHESSGDLAAAKTSYERSLEKAPRGAEPLRALARVLVRQGKKAEAIELLDGIVAQYPDNAIALNLFAELKLDERAFERAAELAAQAAQAVPAWWVPYRTQAYVALAQGSVDGAIAAFETGMKATSGAAPLGMELASLHERAGRPERAIELYESMQAADPASEPLANNLAMLLTTYRTDDASRSKALALVRGFRSSENPAYLNTYGWVRYHQGQLDEAVTYLRRASTALPDNALMHYHLGMALLARGEAAQARNELEKALASEQPFPGRDAAETALKTLPQTPG
jgi:tetratricopeptide (TPR) repeat protein